MINSGLIVIGQLVALLVINAIGVACFGLIFFLMTQRSPTPKAKLFISVALGLISVILLGVMSGDLGIYFWIKFGSLKAAATSLLLLVCGIPIVFPMVTAGSYVQLIYQDKRQEYIASFSQKKPD